MSHEELLMQFKLLSGLLKQSDGTQREELLAGLNSIINEKIPDTFAKSAPPEYFALYTDFRALYEQFCNFILYDKLIGKSVVALGGGFSSGKSSFLNAIDGENALPTDISPSTAVPTFIVRGNKHQAFGVNIFDTKVPIGLKDIRSISHGFGEIRDESGAVVSESVTLGHVLKSVFLASPKQSYGNLAFVDTPGFSKPDSDTYTAKTDEHISRGQLNSSSYIVLFVQADAGTLKDEDIRFIQTLRTDIPKLFIVSKADLKTDEELHVIVAHIKSVLTLSGIAYLDVLTFSRLSPTEYDATAIREVLSRWNKTASVPQFARNFKQLFIYGRTYYEEAIDTERRRLERLNTSMMKIENEDADTLEPLRLLVKEGQEKVRELKQAYDRLRELKDMLFGELKRVCDQIGIDMPEPSEVDMRDDVPDPLQILRDYKKAKGMKSNPRMLENLRGAFDGVRNVLDSAKGGTAHRKAFIQLIQTNCQVDSKNIHINDAANQSDIYGVAIQN